MDLNSFSKKGIIKFDKLLSSENYNRINIKLFQDRKWGKSLFLNEAEFKKQKQFKKINPGKNIQNLTNKYDLSFIEKNQTIGQCLNKILGKNYRIVLKKFIVSVPKDWMPTYVKNLDKKSPLKNLNKFIKKKYRDVTYFQGLDFHMDSIDRQFQSNKFITLYVYLDDVTDDMSPLEILESSHKFGHDTWPHHIRNNTKKSLLFSIDNKKFYKLKKTVLSGNAGDVFIWTSNTLHGTSKPKIKSRKFRISLRYLIEKTSKKKTIIDKILKDEKIHQILKNIDKS
tara:strand:- start:255 stop:1103 length:849 start_codon:yes stop_codon:yes gene_type:complete